MIRRTGRFRTFESVGEDLTLRASELLAKAVDKRLARSRIVCDDDNNLWEIGNALDSFSHGYILRGEDEYLFIGYAVYSDRIEVGYSYQKDGDEVSEKDMFFVVHLDGVFNRDGSIQMADIRNEAECIVDDLSLVLHKKL